MFDYRSDALCVHLRWRRELESAEGGATPPSRLLFCHWQSKQSSPLSPPSSPVAVAPAWLLGPNTLLASISPDLGPLSPRTTPPCRLLGAGVGPAAFEIVRTLDARHEIKQTQSLQARTPALSHSRGRMDGRGDEHRDGTRTAIPSIPSPVFLFSVQAWPPGWPAGGSLVSPDNPGCMSAACGITTGAHSATGPREDCGLLSVGRKHHPRKSMYFYVHASSCPLSLELSLSTRDAHASSLILHIIPPHLIPLLIPISPSLSSSSSPSSFRIPGPGPTRLSSVPSRCCPLVAILVPSPPPYNIAITPPSGSGPWSAPFSSPPTPVQWHHTEQTLALCTPCRP
jgi:hypothetical protein